MKSKSTHYGTCQACGRRQLLPNDQLSLHGYTVQWNFFSGICPGSREDPFEVSCNLIKKFIGQQQTRLAEIQETQRQLREPATEAKCWVNEYHPATWQRGNRRSHHQWRLVDVTQVDQQIGDVKWVEFHYTSFEQKTAKIGQYSGLETLTAICTHQNTLRAAAFDNDVKKIQEYIKWQYARIKDWKPAKLTERSSSTTKKERTAP